MIWSVGLPFLTLHYNIIVYLLLTIRKVESIYIKVKWPEWPVTMMRTVASQPVWSGAGPTTNLLHHPPSLRPARPDPCTIYAPGLQCEMRQGKGKVLVILPPEVNFSYIYFHMFTLFIFPFLFYVMSLAVFHMTYSFYRWFILVAWYLFHLI